MNYSEQAQGLVFLGVSIYTSHINPHVGPSDIKDVTAQAYRFIASRCESDTGLVTLRNQDGHFLLADLIDHLVMAPALPPAFH